MLPKNESVCMNCSYMRPNECKPLQIQKQHEFLDCIFVVFCLLVFFLFFFRYISDDDTLRYLERHSFHNLSRVSHMYVTVQQCNLIVIKNEASHVCHHKYTAQSLQKSHIMLPLSYSDTRSTLLPTKPYHIYKPKWEALISAIYC